MTYNLTLTAQEINLLKEALDNYEQPITDMIEKTTLKAGFEKEHETAKTKLKMVSDLHLNLCYQLSDQQPDYTPLSQREYPQ